MTGSSLVPIIVPIVAFITLAAWLGMVYWADVHPGWRTRAGAAGAHTTGSQPAVTAGASRGHPGSEVRPSPRDKEAA